MSPKTTLEPYGKKVLRRSSDKKMLGGVMGGLADYFGMDPTMMRLIFVIVSAVSVAFPGILVYLIMWVIIPEEESY